MNPPESMPRGRYFEEFELGLRVTTPTRTITEADIVNFAGLSGDYNLIHTDAEYAQSTPSGQRIAHGLLVLSMASGLATRTGIIEGTVLVWRDIENWKFIRPVFIGDTIRVQLEVTGTKPFPRLGGGMVNLELRVQNQDDEEVMKGTWSILIQSKP